MLQEWVDRVEIARLRLHFARVRLYLRTRDAAPELRPQREQVIDALRRYAERGIFPRNYMHPTMRPCFIDPEGRQCAVAHLLIQTGHNAEAQQIAVHANTAYVADMPFPKLDLWAQQHGLTREELTVVQPSYPPTAEQLQRYAIFVAAYSADLFRLLQYLIALAVPAFLSTILSVWDWRKRRWGNLMPVIALLGGLLLIGFISAEGLGEINVLFSLYSAYGLVNQEILNAQTPGYRMVEQTDRVVSLIIVMGVFSLLVGAIIIIRNFIREIRGVGEKSS